MHRHVGFAEFETQKVQHRIQNRIQNRPQRRQQLTQGAGQAAQIQSRHGDVQPLQQADHQAAGEGARRHALRVLRRDVGCVESDWPKADVARLDVRLAC